MPTEPLPSRDDVALEFLDRVPYELYPVQERAIEAWFRSAGGVLVCAPTGTGKTLIAEAAVYEALRDGSTIYYTTPLIALTEQKFAELQRSAADWGFHPDDVGLVTGNRRVNPDARVLVVVAEILLNRLLQPGAEDEFRRVSAVVMDEFHSFSDPERGIVWEFALALLPPQVRLLLLSATVGNSVAFLSWLDSSHRRKLELVQSTDRKVPLSYHWIPDKLLNELLEELAEGAGDARRTPALVFCFNRDECWNVAEQLKGRAMLAAGQQDELAARLDRYDWSVGAGPKLRRILLRGVGVHHAGILPRYRRIVEELFQKKLLTVCVCTETLSAGINLPARSVVLTSLVKGIPGKQKLIDASTAHQIFGRAGRPQFDREGHVYALAHEDDVKIHEWRLKYDSIPEDTRDPGLLRAKKALKKKMPTRSPTRQYWNAGQFERLREAAPRDLASQGALPWRLLAYMLRIDPQVDRLRALVKRRLIPVKRQEEAERELEHMLRILHALRVVKLDPEPPPFGDSERSATTADPNVPPLVGAPATTSNGPAEPKRSLVGDLILRALQEQHAATGTGARPDPESALTAARPAGYRAVTAQPTDRMDAFFVFRGINPVYGLFLLDHLALADPVERIQLLESVLELPGSLLRHVRVPPPHRMPPGPLARERVDAEIVQRGLIPAGDLYPEFDPDLPPEERKYAPPLADKVRMLFESEYPHVHGVRITPAWAAGDVLEHGAKFHAFISAKQIATQEGLIFRHLLRLILLLEEFAHVLPTGIDAADWQSYLRNLADQLTACCRDVDPASTDLAIAQAGQADAFAPASAPVLVHPAAEVAAPKSVANEVEIPAAISADKPEAPRRANSDFGAGLFDDLQDATLSTEDES